MVMSEETELLREINEKLTLLRILASANIDKAKEKLLTSDSRKHIFDLCDGKKEIKKIAEITKTTDRYVNLFIEDLENAGLIAVRKEGNKRYPKRII
jgi:regulatory protein YycH of two-component signal transduction system YycFG